MADAQLRVLRSQALTPPQYLERRADWVATLLEGVSSGAVVPEVEPDPQFMRAATLIHAAGDALSNTAPPRGYWRPSDGTLDQVLGGVATAAQITGVYIEAAQYVPSSVAAGQKLGGVDQWLSVAAGAREALA